MKTYIFPVTFFLTCALSLFASQIAIGKTYKLVDDTGKTSFSDKVSPEEAKYRRETLNKDARVVDVTDKEKSREQQEREKRLVQLRKKQERIMQNQKAYDDALIRSYHSEAEMRVELKEKIHAIEIQKKLIEAELTQELERLDIKQKRAATFERNAQAIPGNLIEEIKAIQDGIQKTKDTISGNLAFQQKVTDEYELNIKRFLSLTQAPEDSTKNNNKVSSIEEADALGLFRCENDHQCKKAWEIARLFVDTYSTTLPDINTDKLVMHALPNRDADISLSISKIASRDSEDQLFLDIHCHDSSLGKDLCNSQKIQELRSSFRPYVNERLSSKVPTP